VEVAFYTREGMDCVVMSFVGFDVGEERRLFVTRRVTAPNPIIPAIRTKQKKVAKKLIQRIAIVGTDGKPACRVGFVYGEEGKLHRVIDPQSLLGTPIVDLPLPHKRKQILVCVLRLRVLKQHLRTTPFLRFEPPHLLRVQERSRLERHRHSNVSHAPTAKAGVSAEWVGGVICGWGADCENSVSERERERRAELFLRRLCV
jgi:hypothetical protein